MFVCSGDILLEAPATCAGVTLSAVATAIDIPVKDATIKVEGDINFHGTLGVTKKAKVGCKVIRLSIVLETDATPEKIETLAKLTERYSVVYQTLKNGVEIETNYISQKN